MYLQYLHIFPSRAEEYGSFASDSIKGRGLNKTIHEKIFLSKAVLHKT